MKSRSPWCQIQGHGKLECTVSLFRLLWVQNSQLAKPSPCAGFRGWKWSNISETSTFTTRSPTFLMQEEGLMPKHTQRHAEFQFHACKEDSIAAYPLFSLSAASVPLLRYTCHHTLQHEVPNNFQADVLLHFLEALPAKFRDTDIA